MLTQDKVIGIFCFVDDLLKALGHKEPLNRKMSDSEVITTSLVGALYFGGHIENARGFMKEMGLVPGMLDKSRFNRRLHGVAGLIINLFEQTGHLLKSISGAREYIIDSFPVAVCDNIRISRSKILIGKKWRGRQSSMCRYFYGVRVQVLVTDNGIPVEFCFVPGSENDVKALHKLPLEVAAESKIYADAAYTDYTIEDTLREAELVELMVQRKSNSKRKDPPWIDFVKGRMRKNIETVFSQLKSLFLRKIHAVTVQGFLLKIALFIIAFTFNKLIAT